MKATKEKKRCFQFNKEMQTGCQGSGRFIYWGRGGVNKTQVREMRQSLEDHRKECEVPYKDITCQKNALLSLIWFYMNFLCLEIHSSLIINNSHIGDFGINQSCWENNNKSSSSKYHLLPFNQGYISKHFCDKLFLLRVLCLTCH